MLELSTEVASHAALALKQYIDSLPRSGLKAPADLVELFDAFRETASRTQVAANRGQAGTISPRSIERVDDPNHDVLLVSQHEAARRLGVSPRQVSRLVQQGALKKRKLGGRALFRVQDLEAVAGDG